MSPDRRTVLERVARQVPAVGRPVLLAVDGADGAGKTWFADDLATVLSDQGRDVVRAGVDDWHHPRAHRHAAGRTGRTVWERSYDYRALRRHLLDPWLRGAGTAYSERWHDLGTDERISPAPRPVPAESVLVLDGVFLQRPELVRAWDVVVWLEVTDDERVRRMADRDGGPDDPAHPDQRRYLEAQAIYREACDPAGLADLVVDNDDPDHPVLRDDPPSIDAPCPTCGR